MLWVNKLNLIPRLTYATLVWWSDVSQKGSRNVVEKLRGLDPRATLGVMETTPIVSLEQLLDI